MTTEGNPVDAGLEELTSEILGDAPTVDDSTPVEQPAEAQPQDPNEPPQATEAPAASAPAPTPQEPQQYDVPGVGRLTAEQIKAMHTTALQFPHLQGKYLAVLEQAKKATEAPTQAPPPAEKVNPEKVQAAIESAFLPLAKQAANEGFIEPDLVELYPKFAANMIMFRETVAFQAAKIQEYGQKIADYEAGIQSENEARENRAFVNQVYSEFDNNLVGLSTKHEILRPLADPKVRAEFTAYVNAADPKVFQLRDQKFVTGLWLSYRQGDLMGAAEAATAARTASDASRAAARRRTGGMALPGSRPGPAPPVDNPVLQEMVDDALGLNG